MGDGCDAEPIANPGIALGHHHRAALVDCADVAAALEIDVVGDVAHVGVTEQPEHCVHTVVAQCPGHRFVHLHEFTRCIGAEIGAELPATTGLVNRPIPSMSISTRSPAFRYAPVASPTPPGVPVRIRSPGARCTDDDTYSMISGTEKIISLVRADWRTWPLTYVGIARSSGDSNSSTVTRQGPRGLNVGKPLPRRTLSIAVMAPPSIPES